jgi:hypothetical protein
MGPRHEYGAANHPPKRVECIGEHPFRSWLILQRTLCKADLHPGTIDVGLEIEVRWSEDPTE